MDEGVHSRWHRAPLCHRGSQRLAVKTPSLRQQIRLLSGGNQQKVILARWLSQGVKVALFDEPTRGIDVGAKSEIYSIIYRLAESGVAVIVVSSELPEVLASVIASASCARVVSPGACPGRKQRRARAPPCVAG